MLSTLKTNFYLIIASLLLFSCQMQQKDSATSTKGNQFEAASTKDMSIPGPRTCFWTRGPVSKDPYMNIAYPDAGVFYWSAIFTMPEGAKLYLEGEFPHSRYDLHCFKI